MAMVSMNMVSAGGFRGVSFHLRRCLQGVASVLSKKTPIFGSRRSNLDHLTVLLSFCLFPPLSTSHDSLFFVRGWGEDASGEGPLETKIYSSVEPVNQCGEGYRPRGETFSSLFPSNVFRFVLLPKDTPFLKVTSWALELQSSFV